MTGVESSTTSSRVNVVKELLALTESDPRASRVLKAINTEGDPMTTPIPEAAVEAAREALSEHLTSDIQIDYCCADIALTAARPHMEADEAERIAAWITAEPQNDKRVNDTMILLADALRRGDYRAATIAERTQR